jgi:hypothetical protein
LVECLTAQQGHPERGSCLTRARIAVEVQDAAATLRLDLPDVPDALQVSPVSDRPHSRHDLFAGFLVEDEPREIVQRLWLDQGAEFRGCTFTLLAAARVAVVVVGDRIWREDDFAFGLPCIAGRVVAVGMLWHDQNRPADSRGAPSV